MSDSAVVWSVSGEQAIGEPIGDRRDLIAGVAFSPDGTRLVVGRSTAARWCPTPRRGGRRFGSPGLDHHRGRLPSRREPRRRRNGRRERAALRSRRPARPSAPRSRGDVRGLAARPSAPTGGISRWPSTPTASGGWYDQLRQGAVQLGDVGSRARSGRRSRRAPARCSPSASARRHAARDRQPPRAARSVGCGHPLPPGRADRVPDDGMLGVAIDSERPAGRRRRRDRPRAGVARGRSAARLPRPLTGHVGPITGGRLRPGRHLARDHDPVRRDQAVGPGHGPRLRRRARRKLEARLALADHRPPPFLGLRNAFSPDGKLLAVSGVETRAMLWDVDPAVWRERACSVVGRNLTLEEWRLYLPFGDALIARRARSGPPVRSFGRARPLPNGQKLFPRGNRRRAARGIVPRAP